MSSVDQLQIKKQYNLKIHQVFFTYHQAWHIPNKSRVLKYFNFNYVIGYFYIFVNNLQTDLISNLVLHPFHIFQKLVLHYQKTIFLFKCGPHRWVLEFGTHMQGSTKPHGPHFLNPYVDPTNLSFRSSKVETTHFGVTIFYPLLHYIQMILVPSMWFSGTC